MRDELDALKLANPVPADETEAWIATDRARLGRARLMEAIEWGAAILDRPLDLLEAPYQSPDIERRAARPDTARTPSWLHGVRVAAATAAAVLVFAGGMMAGRWLLDPGSLLDAAFGGSSSFKTPADVGFLALVAAGASGGSVLLAAALTLAWRWRKRNGRTETIETRGGEMETMEKKIENPERTIQQVTRNNRWLILTVVVLFAALAALGAWLLVSGSDPDAIVIGGGELTERQQEMLSMLDEYTDALLAGDGAAVVEMYAPTGAMTFPTGQKYRVDDGTLQLIVDTIGWVDTTEKPVMVHQNTLRLVHEHRSRSYSDAVEFTSGGDLKIIRHQMMG